MQNTGSGNRTRDLLRVRKLSYPLDHARYLLSHLLPLYLSQGAFRELDCVQVSQTLAGLVLSKV